MVPLRLMLVACVLAGHHASVTVPTGHIWNYRRLNASPIDPLLGILLSPLTFTPTEASAQLAACTSFKEDPDQDPL
jgi:hypothetical protein